MPRAWVEAAHVADLIRYRMQHERYVRRIAESILPTRYGNFRMIAYSSDVDNEAHVALVRGEFGGGTGAAGARSFALLDWRCAGIDGLRLPGTDRAIAGERLRGRGGEFLFICIIRGEDSGLVRRFRGDWATGYFGSFARRDDRRLEPSAIDSAGEWDWRADFD